MLTVKEVLDNATSSLRPVSDTGYPHTLQESLQLYTQYCCGGGEVVSPLPVGLYVWFDFTDETTIAETAGAVGLITDKKSNYPATQNATAARPQLVTGGVQFDGVDDFLNVAISVDSPWTVLVKLERIAGGNDILLSSSYNDYILYDANTYGNIETVINGIVIVNPRPASLLWTYSLRANDVSMIAKMNDNIITNNSSNNATLNINDICRYSTGGYYMSCVLHHIMIFDKFLNDTELADMEAFLNA